MGPTGGSAVEAQSQEDEQPLSEPSPVATAPPTVIRAVDQDRETTVERAPNRLSPAVRRLAAEHNLDVDRIAGTGMGGRVTRNDVLRYLEQQAATVTTAATAAASTAAPPAPSADEERVALTPVRRMIADAMVRSVTQIPHAWSMVEVDITELVACATGSGTGSARARAST